MKNLINNLPPQLTKRFGAFMQLLMIFTLCYYVFIKLSDMGWDSILQNLPDHPLYYAIFLITFTLMPLSESLIYSKHWRQHMHDSHRFFPVLMRKQALNDVVVGYSGEAYLYIWARRHLKQNHRNSLSLVKDATLISGATSSTAALFLLIGFWQFGDFKGLMNNLPDGIHYVGGVMAVSILIVLILVFFGKHLIKVPRREAGRIVSIFTARLVLFESLQVLQWSLILPEVPLSVWIGFVTTKMMITRIPFTPNKELILLGLAVTLSDYVPSAEAALAGLFLTSTVLNQVSNISVFTLTTLAGFRSQKELEDAADDENESNKTADQA